MSDEAGTVEPADTDKADAILLHVTGTVLEGARSTNDPRLQTLSDQLMDMLKQGDVLATLVRLLHAQQTNQAPQEDQYTSQMTKQQQAMLDILTRRLKK